MKKIIVLLLIISFYTLSAKSFFDLSAVNIYGDSLDFEQFQGKKILVVNTASKCGYTYQYGSLQVLYEKYSDDNFEIIGFPANNFANQEPGSDEDIDEFCKDTYGVTFTMMSKISVKGADIHPVYQWLTQESENGVMDSQVQWNFQKYLINPDGTLHGYYLSNINPMAQEIQDWIIEPSSVEIFENEVSIFPVPADNYINISNSNNFTNYKIIDLTGEVVLAGDLKGLSSISTFGISSGTYYLVLSGQNHIFSKRIIINK